MRYSQFSQAYLFLSLGTVLASIAALGIFLYLAHIQRTELALLAHYPPHVADDISDARSDLREMKTLLEGLSGTRQSGDVARVRKAVAALSEKLREDLASFSGYYFGVRDGSARRALLLARIDEAQKELLRHAGPGVPDAARSDELRDLFQERFLPLHRELDAALASMLMFMLAFPDRLAQGHASLYEIDEWLSALLIAMLCLLIFTLRKGWMIVSEAKTQRFHDTVLKNIAEHAGNVFLLFNLKQNRMEYVSPNYLNILGVEKNVLEDGPALFDFCVSENDRRLKRFFDGEVLQTALEQECLFRNPATGEERWMCISIYPIRDAGQVQLYLISVSDMSGVKQTQQTLRDALDTAQRANQSKSSFLSRMSHEIRTPMNAIIGMTTIAANALDDRGRMEDCLTKIAISSRHLLSIINDILDMSKIESGQFSIASEPFEFSALIANVTSIIYPQAVARQQDCNFAVSVEHEHLRGDLLRINQILINILSNAVKYTPEGGRIRMKVKEPPGRSDGGAIYSFVITDTGAGMTPEFLDRLFLPFSQEHEGGSSGQPGGGTGLGMAITKNLVSMMNGGIKVESVPGGGTTFTVTLELEIDEDKPGTEHRLDELKVLVVDDDADACEHTALILSRMGVCVECAFSGEQGVRAVIGAHERDEDFHVAFIDWKMPRMDGYQATEAIRKLDRPDVRDLPIIAMTANAFDEDVAAALTAGMNGHVGKPVDLEVLAGTLCSLICRLPRAV